MEQRVHERDTVRHRWYEPDTPHPVDVLVTGFDSLVVGMEENARLIDRVDSVLKDNESKHRRYWQ